MFSLRRSLLQWALLMGAVVLAAARGVGQEAESDTPRFRMNTGGHVAAVHSVLFAPDGRHIVSCGLDKAVRVRDTRTDDEKVYRYQIGDGPAGQFFAAALAPGETASQVALGTGGATPRDAADILLVDWKTGEQKARLSGHKGTVTGLAYAPDGKTLVSCGTDHRVLLWNLALAHPQPRPLLISDDYMTGVAFSPDTGGGAYLAASGWHGIGDEHYGAVMVWKIDKAGRDVREVKRLKWPAGVLCVAWSKPGVLAYGSDDGVIQLWKPEGAGRTAQTIRPAKFAAQTDSVACLAFNADGSQLISGGGSEGRDVTARVWSVSGTAIAEQQQFSGHITTVQALAFSPDGTEAASGDAFGAVYLWDTQTGETTRSFKGPGSPAFLVAWAKDGRKVAWGTQFGRPLLDRAFDFAQAAPIVEFQSRGNQIGPQWIGAQHQWTAGGKGGKGTLTLARMEGNRGVVVRGDGGNEIKTISLGAEDRLRCYAFAPDGKVIVGSDLYLAVYDPKARGNAPQSVLEGHEGPLLDVSVSPDGKYLASSSVDQTVRIWNLAKPKIAPEKLSVHGADVDKELPLMGVFQGTGGVWAAWTQDGYYAASPAGDDVLGWQLNRGLDNRAEFLTSYQTRLQFFRPDVIPYVLSAGDTRAAFAQVSGGSPPPANTAPSVIQEQLRRYPELTRIEVAGAQPGATENEFIANGKSVTVKCHLQQPNPAVVVNLGMNSSLGRGRYVDERGRYVDERGRYVDERGRYVDERGRYVDERGRSLAVGYDNNASGEYNLRIPSLETGVNVVRVFASDSSAPGVESWATLRILYTPPGRMPVPTLHVLCIGISKYNDPALKITLPGLKDLAYADRDAEDIASFFERPDRQIYKQTEVRRLINKAATKQAIRAELTRLQTNANPGVSPVESAAKPEDTLVLFVSGHGERDTKGDFCLLLPKNDANQSDEDTRYAWKEILDALSNIRVSRIVLLVDHCFSGGVGALLENLSASSQAQPNTDTAARQKAEDTILRGLKESNIVTFTAATSTERSYEDEEWGKGHGAFTYALLNALEGNMPPPFYPGQEARLDYMVPWVTSEVERLTRDHMDHQGRPLSQHPSFFSFSDTDRAVPLARKPQ